MKKEAAKMSRRRGGNHGVFGARSKWRALVTLKPPGGVAPRKKKACPDGAEAPIAKAPMPREPAVPASTTATPPVTANGTAGAATSAPNVPPSALAATALPVGAAAVAPVPAPSAAAAVAVAFGDATAMTVQHWSRILAGRSRSRPHVTETTRGRLECASPRGSWRSSVTPSATCPGPWRLRGRGRGRHTPVWGAKGPARGWRP